MLIIKFHVCPGDQQHLKELGIETLQHMPGVGQNLQVLLLDFRFIFSFFTFLLHNSFHQIELDFQDHLDVYIVQGCTKPVSCHFRPFSSICIGKLLKFAYKFLHFFKNLSHQIVKLTPNLVRILRDIKSRNACNGILTFWFFGILREFSGEIFSIFQIFAKNFTRKFP